MTGSAVPVLNVWRQKKILFKERGVGRGVPRFPQVLRLADDGKRWDSLSPRWTLRYHWKLSALV